MSKVNRYIVTYKILHEYLFTDEDMQNSDYEGEITEDMRKEFLDNLLEETSLPFVYDDMEIEKIEGDI